MLLHQFLRLACPSCCARWREMPSNAPISFHFLPSARSLRTAIFRGSALRLAASCHLVMSVHYPPNIYFCNGLDKTVPHARYCANDPIHALGLPAGYERRIMIDAPKALAAALMSIIAMSAKYGMSRNPVMRAGKHGSKGPARPAGSKVARMADECRIGKCN